MYLNNQALFRGLSGLAADLENYILMPEFFVGIEPKILKKLDSLKRVSYI
jgi:hypothetical protein